MYFQAGLALANPISIYILIYIHCTQVSGDDIFPGGRIKAGAT